MFQHRKKGFVLFVVLWALPLLSMLLLFLHDTVYFQQKAVHQLQKNSQLIGLAEAALQQGAEHIAIESGHWLWGLNARYRVPAQFAKEQFSSKLGQSNYRIELRDCTAYWLAQNLCRVVWITAWAGDSYQTKRVILQTIWLIIASPRVKRPTNAIFLSKDVPQGWKSRPCRRNINRWPKAECWFIRMSLNRLR